MTSATDPWGSGAFTYDALGNILTKTLGARTVEMDYANSNPTSDWKCYNNVLWREDYTPYGEKRQNPDGNKDNEGFTGHIDDDASGLTYMQARYYDPVLGRFLSNDPIGFSVDQPQMFNRYTYVKNESVNMVDPDGKVGKAIRFVRNLHKAKGNPIKAGIETASGIVDNVATLTDGQLNGDDIGAAIDLASGLDKKDQAAIKGATAKARSAIKRRTARTAQRKANVPTSRPSSNAQGHGPEQPRHQFKEDKDGKPAGVFDGSRDSNNNNTDHPAGMEAGPLKKNGVNTHGDPRLDETKQKADFRDHE